MRNWIVGKKHKIMNTDFYKKIKQFPFPWLIILIFFMALSLQIINHIYFKPIYPNFAQILNAISLSLISASIFYYITVSYQKNKQKKIAKSFAIDTYCRTKESIFREISSHLTKRPDYKKIEIAVKNYDVARQLLTEEDIDILKNRPERIMLKEILYELSQLKTILVYLSSYDFIKENDVLYKRILYFLSWIENFHHNYDLFYTEDDSYEFSKFFEGYIRDFLLGQSVTSGERKIDDFISLVENA